MAKNKVFTGFSTNVREQLDARKKLFSKKTERTKEQLLFLNGNGAWVRLLSSVNTLSSDEIRELRYPSTSIPESLRDIKAKEEEKKPEEGLDIVRDPNAPTPLEDEFKPFNNLKLFEGFSYSEAKTGDSTLAKNNILSGYMDNLKGGYSSAPYNPITIGKYKSITADSDSERNSTYQNTPSRGIRPAPGITSLNVVSKGVYGTLREAEIKFQVWSLEDLEIMQALYFRPGFSTLLEWGHSLGVTKTGDLRKDFQTYSTADDDGFFNTQSQKKIEEEIERLQEENEGNYDAMYGYILNYSWNFREDGGYDCTVKVVSKGVILESLAVHFDASNRLTDVKDEGEEEYEAVRRSPFLKVMDGMKKTYNANDDKATLTKRELIEETGIPELNNLQDDFRWCTFPLEPIRKGFKIVGYNALSYISLKNFLDIYNKIVAPLSQKGEKLVKFYTGEGETTKRYQVNTKFVTSEYHFSSDPNICILPKAVTSFVVGNIKTFSGSRPFELDPSLKSFHKEVLEKEGMTRGETNDILNIYLSINFLENLIREKSDSIEISDKDMLSLMKNVLDEVNDALGGVNSLDIQGDNDMYYVVDRQDTSDMYTDKDTSAYEIPLTGLSSTISNLSIESRISSQIAAQIAIAAQGAPGNYRDNIEAFLKWNQGLVDRHLLVKTIESRTVKDRVKKEGDRLLRWGIKMGLAYKDLFPTVTSGSSGVKEAGGMYTVKGTIPGTYDKEKFQDLKEYHKEFSQLKVSRLFHTGSKKRYVPGLVPVELSFDILGIGGLKIGQFFTISSGVLPSSYDRYFGFLVTGLSHSIVSNRWITSVKAQFFAKDQIT